MATRRLGCALPASIRTVFRSSSRTASGRMGLSGPPPTSTLLGNFHDITGQRISKVVNAMKFIEERVTQMAQIWGGLESFNDVEAFRTPERDGDEALLNGPALDDDPTRTSQDAIDALFG